jgi:histone-lysine N-methyltransferase SETMAR
MVTLSRELLLILDQEETSDWHSIITLDESWFCLCTDHELIWFAPGEMIPETERHIIQSPKSMITVAWNTSGFHVLAALLKDAKFNASYYTNEIVEEIRKWRDAYRKKRTRSLIVHADNARPHTARASLEYLEANGRGKAPYPPYSPDLAPSDFLLFRHVKRMLCGCAFGSSGELLSAVGGILAGIEKSVLINVSHE